MTPTAGKRLVYAVTALALLAAALMVIDRDGYAPRSTTGRMRSYLATTQAPI